MVVILYEGTRWRTRIFGAELISKNFYEEGEFNLFDYKGVRVSVAHHYKRFLEFEVKEDKDLEELVDLFSTALGYGPFVKYNVIDKSTKESSVRYQWMLKDAEKRIEQLKKLEKDGIVKNIVNLNSHLPKFDSFYSS